MGDVVAGCGGVSNAAELCHRMLDFCQRLTTAKRKILEDPELYPAAGEEQDMQVSCDATYLAVNPAPVGSGSNYFPSTDPEYFPLDCGPKIYFSLENFDICPKYLYT
jgi:hypothetical protein